MDNYKKGKIQKFLEDKGMADSVFEAIEDSFKDNARNTKDVQLLAANMLGIVLLEKSRGELNRFKDKNEENQSTLKQVGL